MIVVRLQGGLGNQMFQYATGLALARRHRASLYVDPSTLDRDPKRRFMLDGYGIDPGGPGARVRVGVLRMILPHQVERHFGYHQDCVDWPAHVYLDGYWQSPRYFDDRRQDLQRLFLPVVPQSGVSALVRKMEAPMTVALHIRRGDYVEDPQTRAYHGLCGSDYYRTALRCLTTAEDGLRLFVFTDDPEWVSAELDIGMPFELVSGRLSVDATQELWLMSRCHHHIIANSTFGWWAAWLAERPGQKVVMPRQWFADATIDIADLAPPTWLRV